MDAGASVHVNLPRLRLGSSGTSAIIVEEEGNHNATNTPFQSPNKGLL